MRKLYIGTAGWGVPSAVAPHFPSDGTHLERYAARMNCAEVNSSFYRPHQRKTWEKWALATPAEFRFAVKAPKAITHDARLESCGPALHEFFGQVAGLGSKLGPILFQLPPSYVFDEREVCAFLQTLREMHGGAVAFEPRNATWFSLEVDEILRKFAVSRVAADPAKGSALASKPAGESSSRYFRLHGSPRIYWSDYDQPQIESLAEQIHSDASIDSDTPRESWVIFDNTAAGKALKNAIELQTRLVG
jgi:uncharacterized protein YecE (DUF72 family)